MPIYYANKPVGAISYKDKKIKQVYYGNLRVFGNRGEFTGSNITHCKISLYSKADSDNYRYAMSAVQFKINNLWTAANYEADANNKANLIFTLHYTIGADTYEAPMNCTETCWKNTSWGVNAAFMQAGDSLAGLTRNKICGYLNPNSVTAKKGQIGAIFEVDLSKIAQYYPIDGIRLNNSAGAQPTSYFSQGFDVEIKIEGDTAWHRVYHVTQGLTGSLDTFEPSLEFTRDGDNNLQFTEV